MGTNRGVWFPRLSIWKPIHLLKRLETAFQQLRAKHEGLGPQGSSHVTQLDRNHGSSERQDPDHFVLAAGIWVGDRTVAGSRPQIPPQPCKLARQKWTASPKAATSVFPISPLRLYVQSLHNGVGPGLLGQDLFYQPENPTQGHIPAFSAIALPALENRPNQARNRKCPILGLETSPAKNVSFYTIQKIPDLRKEVSHSSRLCVLTHFSWTS